MTNKQLINEAKQKTKGIYGTLYLGDTLVGLASILANVLPGLGMIIVNSPLAVGEIKLFDDAIKGKKPDEKDLVKPFKTQFGSSFYLWIKQLFYVAIPIAIATSITFLITIIYSIVLNQLKVSYDTMETFKTIGVIVLVIAWIIFTCYEIKRICLSIMGQYVLFREKEIDGDEALEKSISLMEGHVIQLLKLDIKLIGYHILRLLLNFTAPIIGYCRVKFFEMIYEGQIEKQVHEEIISKIIQEENNKREEKLNKREEELNKQKKETDRKQADIDRKLVELEKQKQSQNEEKEKNYQEAKSLIDKATTSDEYRFINRLFENLGDYKDSKALLEKYRKVESELRTQEDLLNS